MARFIVRVEARNVLLARDGAVERLGFVTHRAVEAASREDAGESAMEAVWIDVELRKALENDPDDPPLLYLGEVRPAAEGEQPSEEEARYEFFEEQEIDLTALLSDESN